MKLSAQQVDQLVQSQGLKMTPQRRAIVDYLVASDLHPTAEEIFSLVNARFPMTSMATVYNTLNLLKQANLVQEIFENGISRFDPNLSRHYHFVCRACGRVEDIEAETALPVEQIAGHRVETMEVTFRGLCSQCTSGGFDATGAD
jgi:Fur family peroxide stress response transcriptional regulator